MKTVMAVALGSALILLLQLAPSAVAGGGVCDKVECGKGKCVASKHSSVGFVCECDAGWIQSALTGDTDGNDFLPCVYPNCSLDLNCASSHSPFPAPMASPPAADDVPVLNPCRWVNCERGSCKMKSAFDWSCECPRGFYNIDANPAFPCFAPCVLGTSNCSKFAATLSNRSSSSSSPSPLPGGATPAAANSSSSNHGGSSIMKKMKLEWGLLAAALAVLLLKP